MDGSFDEAAFEALQARLSSVWPALTMRTLDDERTVVLVSSIHFTLIPEHFRPLLPAYEERYLFYVLSLARAPRTRVIYVTSQPILPRMLDYFLGLIPGLDREELRRRLVPVSVGDWSPKPLTQKILERPRLLARLRSLVPDPDRAVLVTFATTEAEAQLAVELGIPVYGPHPGLAALGTKSGSRAIFAAAGVPHPHGSHHLRTVEELVDALALISVRGPREAIVKLDALGSGLGNALIDLRGTDGRHELERRVWTLQPEDDTLDAAAFLELLEAEGGIVEERISGTDLRSPSVQLRASPDGDVEVLSTHDQLLGGPTGQTYFGCRFPADAAYAPLITRHSIAVGEELARKGVIGRFGIDFVVTRTHGEWEAHAIEINLRNGGTTHPALALVALTEGEYDPVQVRFDVDGTPKHYVATDHLEAPVLRALTPDDVLDVIDDSGLGWDHASRTGLVFHLISGIGVAGRVGVTAIADSPDAADAIYHKAETALISAAAHSG